MTDDRWDGAAVSRRMRLKTGGFAPTPSSTNMIVYEHHQLPIWLYKHQYNHTQKIVANNTDYIHSTNAPPMLILEIKVIHTMIKKVHFISLKCGKLCCAFVSSLLSRIIECCTFYITLDHIGWACFARYISNASSAALS